MTISRACTFTIACISAFLGAASAVAQMTVNPLEFSYEHPRIGLDIGLSSVWQSGQYVTGCGLFTEGAKINPILGVVYDHPLSAGLRVELFAGFQGRSVESSYHSRENVVLRTSQGEAPVDVDFENVGEANFSYLFLLPSIRYTPFGKVFVGAGLSADLLLTKTTRYTKNISSKTVMIDDLGLSEVYYPDSESTDPYSKVFDEETRDDANGVAFDAVAYLGVEIQANYNLSIVPRVLMTIPLTPVIDEPALRLQSFQFLVGARYRLF